MVPLLVLAIAFWSLIAGLAAVGLVSWRRTARLRAGYPPSRVRPRMRGRTSRTTALAGLAGMVAAGWGAMVVSRSAGLGLAAMAGGLFVAASGVRSRVTG